MDNTIKPKNNRKTVIIAGEVFLLCAFFNALLTFGWAYFPTENLPFDKTSLIGYSLIILIRLFFTLLLPFLFFVWRKKPNNQELFGTNPGLGAFIISFLAGLPGVLIFVSLHNILLQFLLTKGYDAVLPSFYLVSQDKSIESSILTLLLAFLLPVLLQELFFRGVLFSLFPATGKNFFRVFLIALIFALYLQNPVDFIPLFLLGLLLGYIRHATGHVFCAMITQVSMLLTYMVFSKLITYLDFATAPIVIVQDPKILYVSIAAFCLSLVSLVPVILQLHRFSEDTSKSNRVANKDASLPSNQPVEDTKNPENYPTWIGFLTFGLGILLFALSWAPFFMTYSNKK